MSECIFHKLFLNKRNYYFCLGGSLSFKIINLNRDFVINLLIYHHFFYHPNAYYFDF